MSRTARLIPSLALALALTSCVGRSSAPKVAVTDPAPAATSPQGAVQRFAWSWQNRDMSHYSGLLTDDFIVVPALADSSANHVPNPWTLEPEMLAIGRLFQGDANYPAALRIDLTFDHTLIPTPEVIPAWQDARHATIHTRVDLNVVFADGGGGSVATDIHGFALFHLVRGDVARIPARLVAQGVTADSTRWWIERFEDQTLSSAGGLHALPTRSSSWFSIRARYF